MERLTKQEEEVMRHIWALGTCGVKQIVERTADPKPPYTTVASVVSNLKRKGFVRQRRQGNSYIYEPAVDQSDYKRTRLSGFVRDYFLGSYKEMVTFFAREADLSPEDLRDILREIEHS